MTDKQYPRMGYEVPENIDEQLILVWPDGTWCPYEDEEQMTHMSDDFAKLWVPMSYDDDDIEKSVARFNNLFGGE